MNWLTLGGSLMLVAGVAAAQSTAAVMSPVRPMPAPINAPRYGNILFPGGVPQQSHAARLGGVVAGIPPQPARMHHGPRGRTTVVPYAVPVFVGGYGYGGYGYQPAVMQEPQPVTVVMPQQAPPQVIINHHYGSSDAARPTTSIEGSQNSELKVFEATPSPRREPVRAAVTEDADKPNVYLIALKNDTVRQAIGFWVKESTLHYVTPDATVNRVSLDMIDRDATKQLNAQRKLELELPSVTQ